MRRRKDQEGRRIFAIEFSTLLFMYLEGLDLSPRPGNELSVGRFLAGFLSPCRASPIQHISTKQAMTSATHVILILLIILYNLM